MEMELFESSLIYARGHDPEKQLMWIRFKDQKSGAPTSLYEYPCITAAFYAEGLAHVSDRTGELSFGQWFQKFVKSNPKAYPYRRLEDTPEDSVLTEAKERASAFTSSLRDSRTTDFSSGQALPVAEPDIIIPADPEKLKTAALELSTKAAAITINSSAACELAMRTGIAISKMQAALESVFRPEIETKHKAWKAELAILNHYNDPLENDKTRLKAGIVAFRRKQQEIADAEANRLRQEQQKLAEEDARKRSQEMQISDAIEAEERGEPELAKVIMDSPALPMAMNFVAPVHVPVNVPKVKGATHKEKWEICWVDKDGNPTEHPDMSLIPLEYHLVDEKALKMMATRLQNRMNVPGVKAHDAGSVSFSKQ